MVIQDANKSTNIYNLTKEDPGSKETFYHMARIDVDGSFRVYKHPRNGDAPSGGNESCSSSWTEVHSIPNDICGTLIDAVAAGGHLCRAPAPDNGNQKKDHVQFKQVLNVEWPFSDYGLVRGIDEKQCICLDDCLCVVVINEGNENACWKKKFPLSNGRYRKSNTSIVLIKENIGSDKIDQSMVVVLALLLGSSAYLNILFFIASIVAFIYLYRKRLNSRWNIDSTLATNVRSYTYKELEEATRGFKQTVGKGACRTVYKGVLLSDSKSFVAVKRLGKVVEEGEKEFKTEVSAIARGLMYLHEECNTQIIQYYDIKPQNILWDEYFTPEIADFGLAKLLLAEQTRVVRTAIRGTIKYFALNGLEKHPFQLRLMFTVLV
ncbi:G-type lectin S-receptor-like serine/threonine-protein kinase LECRK1 [Quercus lobata]|uniref:G-type lectin S-receptor-like serine/threonine-protein kinase LECRK1 n=1 Tax=Quercus lobata TaxID=97700 RepID=UPI001243ABDE|nr:G-type lectin S-receptor-like serine/threonine-protein kinase LECRK1 [Quercus lobata]